MLFLQCSIIIENRLSGHTHTYDMHTPSKEHSYPIIIGGGPKNGNRTIINLNANQEELEMTMIDDNGAQVGKYKIRSLKLFYIKSRQ
jgi:FlaA1/EpsC-like NDP-sugar epimerase